MLCRQIINKHYIPEVTECIRTNHELHVNIFFTSFSGPLQQWFHYGHNYKLGKKTSEIVLPYLRNQGENVSSIFE